MGYNDEEDGGETGGVASGTHLPSLNVLHEAMSHKKGK